MYSSRLILLSYYDRSSLHMKGYYDQSTVKRYNIGYIVLPILQYSLSTIVAMIDTSNHIDSSKPNHYKKETTIVQLGHTITNL